MKKAYLDNASTTPLRQEVIAEMVKVMEENYGNASSTHSFGRNAKTVLETARKLIAKCINADAREIIFTSSGTEADNWILRSAVKDLGIKRIITAKTEHHAVLNVVEALQSEYHIQVDYVKTELNGTICLTSLQELLSQETPTLVSLMHVNNETGVVLDLVKIGEMCREYKALFHSDTVQSVGKERIDVQQLPIDFMVASAHKFHGPKGVGFAYVKKNSGLKAMIYGGEQEKGVRAGTEGIHQIAGMAKALDVAVENLDEEREYITSLKKYCLEQLDTYFPGYKINGADKSSNIENTFYNILNVLLPLPEEKTAMILFHLDMKGIAVSRGSACQSGSIKPSHVLNEMLNDEDIKKPSLRISFSHFNTKEDIDMLIEALKSLQ